MTFWNGVAQANFYAIILPIPSESKVNILLLRIALVMLVTLDHCRLELGSITKI